MAERLAAVAKPFLERGGKASECHCSKFVDPCAAVPCKIMFAYAAPIFTQKEGLDRLLPDRLIGYGTLNCQFLDAEPKFVPADFARNFSG